MKTLLLVLSLAAVAAPAATAGGMATLGLDPLPTGTPAGETWPAELTIKAHGVTPLHGLTPVVRIRNGSVAREFVATATDRVGVYRADVVFPSEGTWSYEIWDGYTRTHTFAPVAIGAPTGGALPFFDLVLGLALAGVLAAATVVLLRRRPEPQPVHLKEAS